MEVSTMLGITPFTRICLAANSNAIPFNKPFKAPLVEE